MLVQTCDPQLRALPWSVFFETLLADYPRVEVAVSPTQYRRARLPVRHGASVRVLAILGNAIGLDLSGDRHLLETLPNTTVRVLSEPSLAELHDSLWEQGWDILFFAGHSASTADRTQGRMQLNDCETIDLSQLRYSLRKAVAAGLRLAIFNSCDGLGLARELIGLHLPQAIAMREPVSDAVAQAFLQAFLTAFAGGEPLYTAVRQAREQLQPFELTCPGAAWLPAIVQNPAVEPLNWQALQPIDAEKVLPDLPAPPTATAMPNPDQLLLVKFLGRAQLRVEYADLTAIAAEVLVSSDDTNLSMGGGVSAALRRAGGETVWQEARRRAPLELGSIALTTAGRLPARHLLHAAVLDYARPALTQADLIRQVTRRCLELCRSQGWRSLAFPALATGAAGLLPEQAATAMMLEISRQYRASLQQRQAQLTQQMLAADAVHAPPDWLAELLE